MNNKFLVFFLVFYSSCSVFGVDICKDWFEKSKALESNDCVQTCASTPVNLQTHFCSPRCEKLCGDKSLIEKTLGHIAYYPGLTREEQKLVSEEPLAAIKVFLQKEKAEWAAMRVFGRDDENDESDAFRHFLWAGLLSKELGVEVAKRFLDAHEARGKMGTAESAMDLANNRAGLLAAESLRKAGKLTQDQLEKEGLLALKNNSLIVLNSKGAPP